MAVGVYPTAINPVTGALFYPSATTPNTTAPADQGYLTWAYDPAIAATGTIIPTAGLLHLVRVKLDQAATVTNVVLHLTNAGVTLTSGQNFAGLYTAAGARLAVTADQSTAWQTGGVKSMALATPQVCAPGFYYVAFWANGSTLPTLSRGQVVGSAIGNIGLAAPSLRFATADSSITTTGPATFGTQTGSATSWWAALS